MKGLNLFRSRFAALEALVSAKDEERTPEMLAAAQAEMDREGSGLILVPKAEGIQSADQLQQHIDDLVKEASEAKTAATTAQDALKALKGERVLPTQKLGGDKGNGGDGLSETEEDKALKQALDLAHQKPYTSRIMKMHSAN